MKKLYILIIVLILSTLSYFIYDNYFSLKATANQIVENIYKGEFDYSPVNDIMSDEIITKLLLSANKKITLASIRKMRPVVFDIPQNIIKYEHTKTWSNTTKIIIVKDVSKKAYKANESWSSTELYSSYDDFIRKKIYTYKEKTNYEFDDSLKQITYDIYDISTKKFYYRVETINNVKRMQLVFYNIPRKGWKLVAIFQKNI